MMRLNSYLMINGQCEAALKFYEKCLPGKIVMIIDPCEAVLSVMAWLQQLLRHHKLRVAVERS